MLDSPGGQLGDPCTDKASSPTSGLPRCQATVSAEHGFLTFRQMNRMLSIELLHQRRPGPDGSHVVRISAVEATEI